ncbi:hypothetical protein KABACHOK_04900 [Brevundimonas phage vB_BpoS-Kabachok]|uniref:Phosphohydrolase n=1 Tax=Brevundimonas phage vB_BpoS-Kabachok TaxID=2948600 RepID=A0A9E7SJE0_9CAUD|nr:hypothetical protein KABACHOK_04900 [Brevundimonas phage vB_BpoS-Kabachok]
MPLSDTARNNRERDVQVDNNRLSMTEVQLERAAFRLTMKTRIGGADYRSGASDPGTDAALVAQAYLDLVKANRDDQNALHVAAINARAKTTAPLKMYPSIQLASGVYFDFLNPCDTPLSIEDIAAGLSRLCRFTGQLGDHVPYDAIYTIAQHSVLASENCEPGHELAALLHDGAESVIGDMSSPLKQLLPCYKTVEARVENCIFTTFGVPTTLSPEVKAIDLVMLATEKRDLMPRRADDDAVWTMLRDVEPLPFTIEPWSPLEARLRFLHRYAYLTQGVFPKPGEAYATPHNDAPAAYVEGFRRANPASPPSYPWHGTAIHSVVGRH